MSVHPTAIDPPATGDTASEGATLGHHATVETRLFVAGGALVVGHALIVHSWATAVAIGVLALVYGRLDPNLRAAAGALLTPLAGFTAILHVLHVRWDGLVAADLTGALELPAAVAFAVAAALALLARPRRRLSARLVRALATLAGLLLLGIFVVTPLTAAMWLTGKPRQAVTAVLEVPHEEILLRAPDGVQLSGWYVPPRNGAAVVLVHGGGGNRGGVVRHARLLASHGYGVLLYDERGRGRSGGQTNGMGWDWPQDVETAVDWLAARHIGKVGVLGLSTGAEVAITAAAGDPRVGAVVAEGVIGRSNLDIRLQRDRSASISWRIAFAAIAAQTGDPQPAPLVHELRRLAPRPLLLIVGAQNRPEATPSEALRQAAGPSAEVWIADAAHTAALATFPRAYENRVVGFLDEALRPGGE